MKKLTNGIDRSKLSDSDEGCKFNVDTAQFMREEGDDIDFLRKVFDRCSSVEILQITMNIFVGGLYIKPITRVTGHLKIDELRLSGSYCVEESQEIINFVKFNTVRHLSLSIFNIDFVKESCNFFIEAASLVTTIRFFGGLFYFDNDEQAKFRKTWNEATAWLNETGKITATIEEKHYDDNCMVTYITVERKKGR